MNGLNKIKFICEKRIKELYPQEIPTFVLERYERELAYLEKNPENLQRFVLFQKVVEISKKGNFPILLRGMVSGCFLVFLLDDRRFNPIETHYYCKKCGHFEIMNTKLTPMDLPVKACPGCGEEMIPDGYNIPMEILWGPDGANEISFDYGIVKEILPYVKRAIEELNPGQSVCSVGHLNRDYETGERMEYQFSGYVVLPEGQTIEDYEDAVGYLEDGEPCISFSNLDLWDVLGKRKINFVCNDYCKFLLKMEQETGLFADQIDRKILKTVKIKQFVNCASQKSSILDLLSQPEFRTFSDVINITGMGLASYRTDTHTMDSIFQLYETYDWKKYPFYTREDVYQYLMDNGYSIKDAYDITRIIRMGKGERQEEKLRAYGLSEEIIEFAKNCLYLFPKSHLIEFILMEYKIAYYAKLDSKAYWRIKKKK